MPISLRSLTARHFSDAPRLVAFVKLKRLQSISRFPFNGAMSIETSDSRTSSAGSDSADAPLRVGTHTLASRLHRRHGQVCQS